LQIATNYRFYIKINLLTIAADLGKFEILTKNSDDRKIIAIIIHRFKEFCMDKFYYGLVLGLSVFLSIPISTVNAAELIFTAPPREKPAAGKKIYDPIAQHISKLLNAKVVYKHPGNWLNYQREMRDGKYDIVFDGPHFASWRMTHINHDMVAKLPGKLGFMLVKKKDNTSVNTLNDLIGRRICGISMPNLSTLSILSAYPNPVRQPVIVGVSGGMKGVAKALAKDRCDAYVFRDKFFAKKLKPEVKQNLQVIYKSKPLPNQVISAGQRLTPAQKKAIAHSLSVGKGVATTAGLRKRFAAKARSLLSANNAEYKGHNRLLEGVIFGW